MVLLEHSSEGWMIPLTVRPSHLPDHPGQVCLPGGRLESGESALQAAEREFCEELGMTEFPGETLGPLQSIYVYNSDFHLTPLIAVCDHTPLYSPSPDEVEQVIRLPLEALHDPAAISTELRSRGSMQWNSPGIGVEGHHVWGATAIVLGEVAGLLAVARS